MRTLSAFTTPDALGPLDYVCCVDSAGGPVWIQAFSSGGVWRYRLTAPADRIHAGAGAHTDMDCEDGYIAVCRDDAVVAFDCADGD